MVQQVLIVLGQKALHLWGITSQKQLKISIMNLSSFLFIAIISISGNLVAQDSFNDLTTVPYTIHTPKNASTQKGYDKTSAYSISEIKDIMVRKFSYPASMRAYNIEGTSTVSFVLSKSGHIENVEILKSLGGEFDYEINQALANIKNVPPIKVNGKAISQKIILPIHFEL